ncbi:MAG: DNA internalization-related competence protein ComEC/Rec2 [Methylococcales symbiont of Iophon sp. n. MRB-2018]|nr:MAG: DNA internalization-related competence protein ComEC/Rec2 [Methylococcales symbiont of Iophon sp. n. MRB-2018]KAF3979779.1 MAG: DNA internalization-related competence protein ComEC/Rec2 [Methylococcales symbiont of Iophon sp. n. MRB-2018]
MFFLALSFLAGIVVVQQFSELPAPIWLFCLFVLASAWAYFRHWRLMFFTIGLLWAICFASVRMQDKLVEQFEGQYIQLEGKVIGLPSYDERRVRFDFVVMKAAIKNKNIDLNKIRLSWYFPKEKIKSGQHWQFTVKLKKPHGRVNPGGFNYERWLFMQNIGATGYVRANPLPRLIFTPPVVQNIDSIRQFISDKLDHLLGDLKNKGLIKALTIGDKQGLSKLQWQIFRDTGTVHLLAISGLHIGLVSAFAYFLLLRINSILAIRSPQQIAALFAIALAIFYAALAGFSLPTQRALVMLSIAFAAIIWQRNISTIHILSMALLAVLFFDPPAVLSAGFWLSFLAVALIVFCLAGRLLKSGYWNATIKVHCITAMGLSPLLVFYFQQISIISPLANFLSVPVISLLVVPLCLLGVVLIFVSPLFSIPVFNCADLILQGLNWFLSEMALLPFATVTLAAPPVYVIGLAVFGVFLLFSPKGIPARWLAFLFILPLIFQSVEKPETGEVEISLLDVGQGLSAVVQTKNRLLLFDTGAKFSEQYDMGDAVVVPFLKHKALKTIDMLIISHGDNDHIGGMHSILKYAKVNKLLTSVSEQLVPDAQSCYAGQSWLWDQVLFEILSPPLNKKLISKNNNSCVLKISAGENSLLLTGDIEENAEKWLIKHAAAQLSSDVLVAPHHGSKTSSSLDFLQHIQAKFVLIPAGYRNRFLFPHRQVLERYKKMNAVVFNTANDGALIVELNPNKIAVESIRSKQRKYWNH